MTESSCEIVFRGKVLAGFDRDQVRANLAQLLGLAPPAVDAILAAPKTVLRSGVDKAEAAEFKEALLHAGIMVAVITMPSAPEPSAQAVVAAAPDAFGPLQHVIAAHLGPSSLTLSDQTVTVARTEPRQFEAPKAKVHSLRISKSSEHVAAQPAPAQAIKELDLTIAELEQREEKAKSKLIEAITKDARRR